VSPHAHADDFARKLTAARAAEAAGDRLSAFFLYSRAAELNPSDTAAALQADVLGSRLLQTSVSSRGPDPAQFFSPDLPPEERAANHILLERLAPTEAMVSMDANPAMRLKPSTQKKSFDIRGSVRPVIEEVTRGFGVQTIFEQGYQNTATVNYRTDELTRDEAFRVLEAICTCFFVPIRDNTVIVFRETNENRTNNAPAVTAVIPIPDRMNVQEAQELATGVQTICDVRRMALDPGRHLLIVRGEEYKVIAAQRLIRDLMRLRAQVKIDVELLLVAKNSTLTHGVNLQSMFQIVPLNNPVALAKIGSIASSWFGIGLANAQVFASISRSSTQASLRAEMTALDGQQARLHIGDQYPIETGRGGFGTAATSVAITQYRDLGLNLTITPVVHAGGEVTLTIEGEYSALTAGTNNGIPIIANRKFTTTARINSEEWAVVSGFATSTASYITDGIPGLSDIPVLRYLFRKDTITENAGDILLLLKPRIVTEPVWERPSPAVWMGSETKPATFY
jgi:general secretion pathway protein D